MSCAVMMAVVPVSSEEPNQGAPTMKLNEFPLSQVRLLDGRFKDEQDRDRAYLRALDPDRLLYTFRQQAGLPAPGEPLGGWEAPSCEVRGHFLGHYLTACAMMYAAAGDEELKARADLIVAELSKCQQAMGGEYLSAFPESVWDRLETGQGVWAPYYVIHKIIAGLCDVYALCGNEHALGMAQGMAAYFQKRLDPLPPDTIDRILRQEFGGMSEGLHNLYALTGNPEHLDLAHRFDQPEFLGPLALGHDNLTRIHGNTQIPKVIGAARRYELTGDARYRDLAMFFWDRVVNTRTYATGGSTIFEHWPEPSKLAQTLGHLNHETCKAYNMLKLTRHLLEWTGDVQYGDFYERGLLNGILGTQGPEPGQLEYYVAMGSGYPRVFGTPETSFWCCYGTGIESFAKLGDSLYFHDGKNLFVNGFVSSALDWAEQGLRVEQHTRYPHEDTTRLTLRPAQPRRFTLCVRAPYWLADAPEVRVNGQRESASGGAPGTWLALDREWRDGDEIEVRFPMKLHTLALPDDPEQVAVLYGPVVLAGILDERAGEKVCVGEHHEMVSTFQTSCEPVFFTGDAARPETWLTQQNDALVFHPRDTHPDLRLIPFGDVVRERYALYWPVAASGSPREQELREHAAQWRREVDRVFPFVREVTPECPERRHNQQGEKTVAGIVLGTAYCYRHAEPGGWFSWELEVLPDQPMELLCAYWGGDTGRTFDILVEGQRLATQALTPDRPGQLLDHTYPIPPEWTRGKQRVTVRFEANHETIAGGVFGCATLGPQR
jgi:hypothetical protein